MQIQLFFSSESDEVYEKEGIKGFFKNEQEKANIPIQEGPFAPLVKLIYQIQKSYASVELCPIRTALITARSAPAHKRAIMTFRKWDIRIDEVFFLGDIDKTNIIKSFGAQIFFDDSDINIEKASKKVSSAKVFK